MGTRKETSITFVRTFYRDIRSIDCVIREITSWFSNSEDTECDESVNFKSKIKNDVTLVCKGVSTEQVRCTTLLENTSNRINQFLYLLIKYMNKMKPVEEHFISSLDTNTCTHVSLSALVNMLWQRIQYLHLYYIRLNNGHGREIPVINIKDTTSNSTKMPNVCSGSQTEVCSLINCANCTLSMIAVKTLVHLIDVESRKYGAFNTSVSKVRSDINKNVLNISQWSAMQNWIKAVYEDLLCFNKLLHLTNTELKYLKNNINVHSARSIEKIKRTCRKKLIQIQNCNSDILIKLRKEKKKTDDLSDENNKLHNLIETKETEIRELKKKIEKYEILLKNSKTDINLLKSNFENKSFEIQKLRTDWEKINIYLEEKIDHTEREIESKSLQLSHMKVSNDEWANKVMVLHTNELLLHSELTKMKTENENLQKSCLNESSLKRDVESELENCLRENTLLKNEKEDILKTVLELEKKIVEHNLKNRETEDFMLCCAQQAAVVPQFKCTGDPITDMEAQRKANKIQIKFLTNSNARLKNTISKLKTTRSNILHE